MVAGAAGAAGMVAGAAGAAGMVAAAAGPGPAAITGAACLGWCPHFPC